MIVDCTLSHVRPTPTELKFEIYYMEAVNDDEDEDDKDDGTDPDEA